MCQPSGQGIVLQGEQTRLLSEQRADTKLSKTQSDSLTGTGPQYNRALSYLMSHFLLLGNIPLLVHSQVVSSSAISCLYFLHSSMTKLHLLNRIEKTLI